MRRRSQQLPAVSQAEFERKLALLRLARQYAEGGLAEAPLGAPQQLPAQSGGMEGFSALSGAAAAFHAAVRCNKGRDHLKRQQPQEEEHGQETAEAVAAADERSAAAKAAAAAWRSALQQHPERCNLFQQMPPFASAGENLAYMKKAYGFFVRRADAAAVAVPVAAAIAFADAAATEAVAAISAAASAAVVVFAIFLLFCDCYCCCCCCILSRLRLPSAPQLPDEEYCTNPGGLLRCIWREQQQQPCCLFCGRRFRGIRAALQHMQQQRHFQLRWDEGQQELLARFYDYKKSYYDVS